MSGKYSFLVKLFILGGYRRLHPLGAGVTINHLESLFS